jgi:hypothetical protein
MPNKTKTLSVINIPDKYFFDFLRGHHDGDGCFYSYFDPRWKNSFLFYLVFTSASRTHLLWLQGVMKRLLKVKGHITKNKQDTFYQLKYAKRETLLLLVHLYPRRNVVCLSRKRLKIERALRIVGVTLP